MPTRSTPQDINAIVKDFNGTQLRVGLVCPTEFIAGKSHLALQILYHIAHQFPEIACERIFLPDPPDRHRGVPPLSRETGHPMKDFDLLAFSFSFELQYPWALWMLQQGGIPVTRQERLDSKRPYPFMLFGGLAISANPAPLRSVPDAIFIGEADFAFGEILQKCLTVLRAEWGNVGVLGKLNGILLPGQQEKVKRTWIPRLDDAPYPIAQILPRSHYTHETRKKISPLPDSFLLEVNRGCPNWCRFCLAGHTTRPFRNRSLPKLLDILENGVRATPIKQVTLIGSAVADYPHLTDLLQGILNLGLEFSLPSVRLDRVDDTLLTLLRKNKSRTITIAPEAALEDTRRSIGKDWSNAEILEAVRAFSAANIHNLKLYFLLGLPGSLQSEGEEIPHFVKKIAEVTSSNTRLRVSVNPFVPKAQTPLAHCTEYYHGEGFQNLTHIWEAVQKQLRKIPRVFPDGYEPRWAQIQTLISLAGPDITSILNAWGERGNTLGGLRAVARTSNLNLDRMIESFSAPEHNPWAIVDVGIKERILNDEFDAMKDGKDSPPCHVGCQRCGLCL